MTSISSSIHIDRPIVEIFRFVTTPANWPKWHPSSVAVSAGAEHPLRVGEQVTEDFTVAGRRGRATWTVKERIEPSRWVIEGSAEDGGGAKITYTLAADGSGTAFRRELVYAMPNPLWALLDLLLIRRRVRAESAEALRRLKRLLEISSPA